MDTATSTTDVIRTWAEKAGHSIGPVVMLQARCWTCGFMVSYATARRPDSQPCPGRVALSDTGGHWLLLSKDETLCRLCGGHFDGVIISGRSHVERGDTVELRTLPACSRCDHVGALRPVVFAEGDPRLHGLPVVRANQMEPQECTACGTPVLTLGRACRFCKSGDPHPLGHSCSEVNVFSSSCPACAALNGGNCWRHRGD